MLSTGINLTEILDEPYNRLIEGAVEKGMVPIGYACSMVPEVLLSLGNIFPVRLRAPHIGGTEMSDVYLSSVMCSLTRSLLEYALEGRYSFIGGYVFTASCDHLRRLNDNLEYCEKPEFIYILDIPHKYTDAALEWTIDELKKFAVRLEERFGVDASDESVKNAIKRKEALNEILRHIGEMRRMPEIPFSGADYHRLITAMLIVPPDDAMRIAKEFLELAQHTKPSKKYRARVMLVGGNLDDPSFTEVIESQGALVVADRFCTGSFPELEAYQIEGDPYEILARRILTLTKCPRMMEGFSERLEYIEKLYHDFAADGIIIESIKFCDTWGVETSMLVTQLREKGIPVLRLEREYRLSGEGQLRTRVQAFIESMGK